MMRTEPLLDTNPTLAIVYIVIVGIALLVGTIGNVLIIIIFTVMRRINKSGKEFMVNLAIADLCVTAIADPLCILGVVKGEEFFDDEMWTCELVAASLSYTLFVCIGTLLQLSMIGIFYLLIFLQIWKTKRNVFKLESDNPLWMRRAWNETIRSSKVLFCVFVVFVVCWTPYCITMILDVGDNFSTEVHLFVTLLAHLHSSVNCIIYTTGNKKFRLGIVRLYCNHRRSPM
eukprot:XP_019918404.1 PREDICTED: melatonin receptor type 1B [Crassostrea gigas]